MVECLNWLEQQAVSDWQEVEEMTYLIRVDKPLDRGRLKHLVSIRNNNLSIVKVVSEHHLLGLDTVVQCSLPALPCVIR
jgi:hypothetical protein